MPACKNDSYVGRKRNHVVYLPRRVVLSAPKPLSTSAGPPTRRIVWGTIAAAILVAAAGYGAAAWALIICATAAPRLLRGRQ